MKILGSKKIVMLVNIFAIGSFQASCCSDDEAKKVEIYMPEKPPKTFTDCITGSFKKATEKIVVKKMVEFGENITDSPMRWVGTRYAAICRYAQFRNTNKILRDNDIERLKTLAHQVLEHARANDCDYDDYMVIAKRVQECARYIEARLRLAHSEYIRTAKRSRSLLQRTAGLVTSSYDVHSIIQIVDWMIVDLEELYERSQYTKGFDIDHYKKVICYLQADLDTLFTHLEELV